jgi:hypothetical protein
MRSTVVEFSDVETVAEPSPRARLVTDYARRVITFDILRPDRHFYQLIGRGDGLLSRLATMPGVTSTETWAVIATPQPLQVTTRSSHPGPLA